MPIGHMFMYGGNKACDCEPDRFCDSNYCCDIGKDWYTEIIPGEEGTADPQKFNNWDDGETKVFPFDNMLDNPVNSEDEVTLERINLMGHSIRGKREGLDHQYAFKLTTGVEPETGRTPVIIAGGRGSDVSNLWDQKVDKVLDISDFPNSNQYTFYSMDYPGYGGSNPQDAMKLPGGEGQILDDYQSLFNYVQKVEGSKKPLLSGVSMGAGVVQGLAERIFDANAPEDGERAVIEETGELWTLNDEISGMMLINPFKTGKQATLDMFKGTPRVFNDFIPFMGVLDEWDSATRMEKLAPENVPTLVLSATNDNVISSEQHRELFKIAAELDETPVEKTDLVTFGNGDSLTEAKKKLLIQETEEARHKHFDLTRTEVKDWLSTNVTGNNQ